MFCLMRFIALSLRVGVDVVDEISLTVILCKSSLKNKQTTKQKQPKAHCRLVIVPDFLVDG